MSAGEWHPIFWQFSRKSTIPFEILLTWTKSCTTLSGSNMCSIFKSISTSLSKDHVPFRQSRKFAGMGSGEEGQVHMPWDSGIPRESSQGFPEGISISGHPQLHQDVHTSKSTWIPWRYGDIIDTTCTTYTSRPLKWCSSLACLQNFDLINRHFELRNMCNLSMTSFYTKELRIEFKKKWKLQRTWVQQPK